MQPEDIKELRKSLKLSQEKLAALFGISWNTINRWERGLAKPSPMAMQKLEELIKKQGQL